MLSLSKSAEHVSMALRHTEDPNKLLDIQLVVIRLWQSRDSTASWTTYPKMKWSLGPRSLGWLPFFRAATSMGATNEKLDFRLRCRG